MTIMFLDTKNNLFLCVYNCNVFATGCYMNKIKCFFTVSRVIRFFPYTTQYALDGLKVEMITREAFVECTRHVKYKFHKVQELTPARCFAAFV